jgi:hypothetical protein
MTAIQTFSRAEAAHRGRDFFLAMERTVADGLVSAGYSVIRHDSQEWPVSCSISGPNTGGTIALFFGPLYEKVPGWTLPYEVVREAESRLGEIRIPQDATPESAAALFLQKISGILTNRSLVPHHVGVGAGLLSVEDATKIAETAQAD